MGFLLVPLRVPEPRGRLSRLSYLAAARHGRRVYCLTSHFAQVTSDSVYLGRCIFIVSIRLRCWTARRELLSGRLLATFVLELLCELLLIPRHLTKRWSEPPPV